MKGYISIQIKVDLKANLYRSFVVFYIYCHWRSKGGEGVIRLTGLTQPHFCICPKP
jgi:hypothetical protein